MKKLFTLIAITAFLAACGGNSTRRAQVAEEQAASVETTVECCGEKSSCEGEETCCDAEKACCDTASDVAVAEETAAQ